MSSGKRVAGYESLRRFLAAMAVAIAWTAPASAMAQAAADLSGRVFEARSKAGIENLEVKLTPPRSARLPIRLSQTNRNGDFLFQKVPPGRYLIEVSQGLHILYRVEIDSSRQARLEIPLQRQR